MPYIYDLIRSSAVLHPFEFINRLVCFVEGCLNPRFLYQSARNRRENKQPGLMPSHKDTGNQEEMRRDMCITSAQAILWHIYHLSWIPDKLQKLKAPVKSGRLQRPAPSTGTFSFFRLEASSQFLRLSWSRPRRFACHSSRAAVSYECVSPEAEESSGN